MADYAFASIWRLHAPIDRVYDLIENSADWPRWWPYIAEAREIDRNGPDGIGALYDFTFRTALPYKLRFRSRLTRRDRPHALVGTATGELDGVGEWALSEADGWTTVRYDWRIRTTRWWMNAFAWVPLVKPIFGLNHHAVMRGGLIAARKELGVAGTYEKVA
jgi:hypothetical protein